MDARNKDEIIAELTQMGIKNGYIGLNYITDFEIVDVANFGEEQLKKLLTFLEKNNLRIRKYIIPCNDFENIEEKIKNIQLIQARVPNGSIEIDGELGKRISIEEIFISATGRKESSRVCQGRVQVTLDMLMPIYNVFQKNLGDNEILNIVSKYDMGTGEESIKYQRGVLIDDVTQLSKEQAIKLKESGIEIVQIKNDYSDNYPDQYEINKYIAIMDSLQELVKGIDLELPEVRKFELIYRRVCKGIEYDYVAAYPKGDEEIEYSMRMITACGNLENGLLEKKCVCSGYAEILRNALLLCEIECKRVSGKIYKDEETLIKQGFELNWDEYRKKGEKPYKKTEKGLFYQEQHAWNKVKINGKWFNVDATWDRPNVVAGLQPSHALKSDEYIEQQEKKIDFGGPKCERNATQEELNVIFPIFPIEEPEDERAFYYDMYPEYAKTTLGNEIIKLMMQSYENDAEILNWSENILRNGTPIDVIKQEIYRLHPTWREYKKTKVGLAVMRLLEAGALESDILKINENCYFDENGVTIEEIHEEIYKQQRREEQSQKELDKQKQEGIEEKNQEENNKKKGKNPIQDVVASNIKLSTINEVTNNIKAKITSTIKDKETSKVITSQEEQYERE